MGTVPCRGTLLVFVRDNNVNAAMRAPKKKMQREDASRELKRRRADEKAVSAAGPGKAGAARKYRKAMRKQLKREGYWPREGRPLDPRKLIAFCRWNMIEDTPLATGDWLGRATTPAIKEHLRDVADQYERVARRIELSAPAEDDTKGKQRPLFKAPLACRHRAPARSLHRVVIYAPGAGAIFLPFLSVWQGCAHSA
jgi:ribosomal protein S21